MTHNIYSKKYDSEKDSRKYCDLRKWLTLDIRIGLKKTKCVKF